jgi:hypothetical protein
MATIQLSAMFTQIAGSIGGTTFRRNNGSIIAQRRNGDKLIRTNRTARALQISGYIMKHWATLDNVEHDFWSALSKTKLYPDKFGVMRNLPPHLFYIKVNYLYFWRYNDFFKYSNIDFNIIVPSKIDFYYSSAQEFGISFTYYTDYCFVTWRIKQVKYLNQPVRFNDQPYQGDHAIHNVDDVQISDNHIYDDNFLILLAYYAVEITFLNQYFQKSVPVVFYFQNSSSG